MSDRIKVYKDNEFVAYLSPVDIEELKMEGEYRKRINPKDFRKTEKIFVLKS